jgi:energy-coupling factor transporter ATP-binding protein EcfA2
MRVKRVSVTGLFGVFDHPIDFNLRERITIIHGPNGYGKTIILRMIDGLLSGSYEVFYSVPYSKFEMTFDDGSRIEIEKAPSQLQIPSLRAPPNRPRSPTPARTRRRDPPLACKFVDSAGNAKSFNFGLQQGQLSDRVLRDLDRLLPSRLRLHGDRWLDSQQGTILMPDQVIRQWGDYLRSAAPQFLESLGYDEQSPLHRVQGAIHVHLIKTERLGAPAVVQAIKQWHIYPEDTPPEQPSNSVERYSQDIVTRFGSLLAQYAGRASELDRTFPERLLLETEKYEPIPKEGLKTRFDAIERQRANLIELGFLDREQGGLRGIPDSLYETQHKVLSVYVSDMEEKLRTFTEMATKVGLLTQIVNERFKHKTLRINRERGFVFESKLGEVAPADLSSGEQHELVLLYELLFKVDNTWLVLLDEPEISLHVGWQDKFLDDLKNIVSLSSVDVVIATHSPVIIGEHWDLTVALRDHVEEPSSE